MKELLTRGDTVPREGTENRVGLSPEPVGGVEGPRLRAPTLRAPTQQLRHKMGSLPLQRPCSVEQRPRPVVLLPVSEPVRSLLRDILQRRPEAPIEREKGRVELDQSLLRDILQRRTETVVEQEIGEMRVPMNGTKQTMSRF